MRRATWILKKDTNRDIMLSDVNRDGFMLELFGVDLADAHAEIHAVYMDGKVIKGVAVVRAILEILGYKKTLALINFPIIRSIFNKLNEKISDNKHRISI